MAVIPTNRPWINNEEIDQVVEVLKSGFLSNPSIDGGEKVRQFEKMLTDFTGSKYAVALSSGTTALHASLLALEIQPGDEVIVPPITFGATASTVLMMGAKPVFADISLNDFNISIESISAKITDRTKAIIPVDLFGLPFDYDALRKISGDTHIIEDGAQSLGADYKDRKAGNLGDLSCISFYPGKVVTAGEGGAILTNNKEIADKLRIIRTGGQSKPYQYGLLGSNFRMSEIHAAIGVAQMKKLTLIIQKRRANAEKIINSISKHSWVRPAISETAVSNQYILTLFLEKYKDKRDEIVKSLQNMEIDGRAYYTVPLYNTELFREFVTGEYPNTEEFCKSTFSVPVHPLLTEEELEKIIISLDKILTSVEENVLER